MIIFINTLKISDIKSKRGVDDPTLKVAVIQYLLPSFSARGGWAMRGDAPRCGAMLHDAGRGSTMRGDAPRCGAGLHATPRHATPRHATPHPWGAQQDN